MNGFRGGSAWKRPFIFSAPPYGLAATVVAVPGVFPAVKAIAPPETHPKLVAMS
jgi:hypothetical protein